MCMCDMKQKERTDGNTRALAGEGGAGGGALETASAVTQGKFRQSLDDSPRVQNRLDLGRALNEGPRVVAQAKFADDFTAGRNARRTQRPDESDDEGEDELEGGKCDSVTQCVADPNAPTPQPTAAASAPNRTGLPAGLKAGVEQLSGTSLSDVRVHYNSPKPAQLQALAYTQGPDIHVAAGQERHLPHEAWHAAQQKQGRVSATTQLRGVAVNDDSALEREAEAMGAHALRVGASGTTPDDATRLSLSRAAVTTAPAQRSAVAQLAAPGPIEHAISSCFVAALINIFTVTKSLKNLLTNNDLTNSGDPHAVALQGLLARAVNTVDAAEDVVPRVWVRNIMAWLSRMGIIESATDTEDVNSVLAQVVERLSGGDATAGQPNQMPVSTGLVMWDDSTTLDVAALATMQQLQEHDPLPGVTFPNVVHVNRQVGNDREAPPTFSVYPAVGGPITYRLRAVINRDAGYVGGHFVSYVDRGDDDNEEWWESDDVGPVVRPVGDLRAVGGPVDEEVEKSLDETVGKKEQKELDEEEEQQQEQKTLKTSTESAQTGGSGEEGPDEDRANMLAEAVTYVYERDDAQEVEQEDPQFVQVLPEDIQDEFDEIYNSDFKKMLAAESEWEDSDEIDFGAINEDDYDKDLQKASDESEAAMKSVLAVKLPPVYVGPAQLEEAQRQLRMQLAGLNRMTVKQWVFNTVINRMKTADQLSGGYKTKGGLELAVKIDDTLSRNDDLARQVMDEIIERMKVLSAEVDLKELPDVIRKAQAAKAKDKDVYMEFRRLHGLSDLEVITRTRLRGGIGRQHGVGDEDWFKKEFKTGLLLSKTEEEGVQAVLHNPDQCAGGPMEILCDAPEMVRLRRAKETYEKLLKAHLSAESKQKEAESKLASERSSTSLIMTGPSKMTQNVVMKVRSRAQQKTVKLENRSIMGYVKPVKQADKAKVEEETKKIRADRIEAAEKEVELAESNTESVGMALEDARRVYKELTLRSFGDYNVNSALGRAWVERFKEGGTRVSRLLDAALKLPRENWDAVRMGASMEAVVDPDIARTIRPKTEKGKQREQDELDKIEAGKKRGRSASATEKQQEKKKKKQEELLENVLEQRKRSGVQPSWQDWQYRREQKAEREKATSSAREREVIVIEDSDESEHEEIENDDELVGMLSEEEEEEEEEEDEEEDDSPQYFEDKSQDSTQ